MNTQPVSPSTDSQIEIVFYCKDCHQMVQAEKVGVKYVYKCTVCNSENVAFGTKKSLENFFHVKGSK